MSQKVCNISTQGMQPVFDRITLIITNQKVDSVPWYEVKLSKIRLELFEMELGAAEKIPSHLYWYQLDKLTVTLYYTTIITLENVPYQ